jgi:hypothetical protein
MTTFTKVYPVTKSLVDVFLGDGWKNWTRLVKKGDVFVPQKGNTALGSSVISMVNTYMKGYGK